MEKFKDYDYAQQIEDAYLNEDEERDFIWSQENASQNIATPLRDVSATNQLEHVEMVENNEFNEEDRSNSPPGALGAVRSPRKKSANSNDAAESPSNVQTTTPASQLTIMSLQTDKAGLPEAKSRRAEQISKIINEASKGSKFYKKQKERESNALNRARELREKWRRASKLEQANALRAADDYLVEAEIERRLDRTFIHIDMDMFYVAVELKDRPDLIDKPVAVGGMHMLSTSSYVARQYGVRSAMPGFIAIQLCPDLVILPTNFQKYKAVGEQIRAIFRRYDPHFRSMSLDECSLDVTEFLQNEGESLRQHFMEQASTAATATETAVVATSTATDTPILTNSTQTSSKLLSSQEVSECSLAYLCAKRIQELVLVETSLTCSCGIGPNSGVAKLASNVNKPHGIFEVASTKAAVISFVHSLGVRSIQGIGKITETILAALGITEVPHLFEHRAMLFHVFSSKSATFFMRAYLGIFSSRPNKERVHVRKSLSTERTFGDESDTHALEMHLWRCCLRLSKELLQKRLMVKCVCLKVKHNTFRSNSRQGTLLSATQSASSIFSLCVRYLREMYPVCLRLLGVRLATLESDSLTDEEREKKLEEVQFEIDKSKSSDTDLADTVVHELDDDEMAAIAGNGVSGVQRTLQEAWTNGGSKPRVREPCPVCAEQLEEMSVAEANNHVLKCLEPDSIVNGHVKASGAPSLSAHSRKRGDNSDRPRSKKQRTLQSFFGASTRT